MRPKLVSLFAGLTAAAALLVGQLSALPTSASPERPVAARGAPLGDVFRSDDPYNGSFPDPTVMEWGGAYYLASTTLAQINLPMLATMDMREFIPVGKGAEPFANPPRWAETAGQRKKVRLISLWAPSLARIAGNTVMAYSAGAKIMPSRRSCIGLAHSVNPDSPTGPFVDVGGKALACGPRGSMGIIDPDLYVAPDGTPYLLYRQFAKAGKNKQKRGILIRQLDPTASGWAPGSKPVVLLGQARGWERQIIENPSMIWIWGRYYLFYSANSWKSGNYATGYAICDSPVGPCRRAPGPLLASGPTMAGPGGADTFFDSSGTLRLVFHAYLPGAVGVGSPRRLHTATLAADPLTGYLTVAAIDAALPGPEPTPTVLPTPTPTASPTCTTVTPTPTPTLTPTPTSSTTLTGTASATGTGTGAPTLIPTGTDAATATATATATGTGTASSGPTGSVTPTGSATATSSVSPSVTPTPTPTVTASPSPTLPLCPTTR